MVGGSVYGILHKKHAITFIQILLQFPHDVETIIAYSLFQLLNKCCWSNYGKACYRKILNKRIPLKPAHDNDTHYAGEEPERPRNSFILDVMAHEGILTGH
jgi:hypothetical protein